MAESKEPGLKSAFDLAMERLAKANGGMVTLTDAQKEAIGEVARRTQAKLAELEIMFRQRIEAAAGRNDAEAVGKLESEQRAEIRRVREREEADKQRIREGA